MRLSKTALNIQQEVYMLTNLAVEVGGISRAFYASGLIIAHFVAL